MAGALIGWVFLVLLCCYGRWRSLRRKSCWLSMDNSGECDAEESKNCNNVGRFRRGFYLSVFGRSPRERKALNITKLRNSKGVSNPSSRRLVRFRCGELGLCFKCLKSIHYCHALFFSARLPITDRVLV